MLIVRYRIASAAGRNTSRVERSSMAHDRVSVSIIFRQKPAGARELCKSMMPVTSGYKVGFVDQLIGTIVSEGKL
jgi:hypothetical protein